MDDFKGFKTSVEEATADVVEIAREIDLEVSLKMGLNCCNLMIKLMVEELLLMDEQIKEFLEMDSTTAEDAVNIVEMIRKDLKYYTNLVEKAAVKFKRIDSDFERNSTVCQMLPKSISCYREIFHERRSQSMWQTSLVSFFF